MCLYLFLFTMHIGETIIYFGHRSSADKLAEVISDMLGIYYISEETGMNERYADIIRLFLYSFFVQFARR